MRRNKGLLLSQREECKVEKVRFRLQSSEKRVGSEPEKAKLAGGGVFVAGAPLRWYSSQAVILSGGISPRSIRSRKHQKKNWLRISHKPKPQ